MARTPTVVIVGAGFGGLEAAKNLARAPVRVILIDRNNYHLFQPLLYQVAMAGLEPSSIARPVRRILRGQKNFEFRMAEMTGLDRAAHVVHTSAGDVPYDFLILAAGGRTNYFGIDSIARNALGLKGLSDAVNIRNHVLSCIEQAVLEPDLERRRMLLTFLVVGGGPTGVEMAGALAELIRLVLSRDTRALNTQDTRILLLEAGQRLLPGMRPGSHNPLPRCSGRSTSKCGSERRSKRSTANRRGSPAGKSSRPGRSSGPPAWRRSPCPPCSACRRSGRGAWP